MRYLPQTASLFARHRPAGQSAQSEIRKCPHQQGTVRDGANILVIEGTIVSTSNKPAEVPRLRFSARNSSGQEVYTWTALPSRSILEPGESLDFSSRLVSPPADASDVMVRFFNAQDTIGGK
ncbi:MAG: FxLYD domain-containing protein [Pseudolabrys sp.]